MHNTIIIGGGVIGLSVAYHLAKRGLTDVLLLERNQLTSGTSWHAAGIVGPLRATPNMTRLASHALSLFPELEAETGHATGFKRTGGYWLAREEERLDELHRIADLGRTQGLSPQVIPAHEVAVPTLDLTNHVGALYVPEDGNVNPVDLCMAYARGAKMRGVTVREGVGVSGILKKEGRAAGVRLADGTQINAENVILCAGAWSKPLAEEVGLALPLQAVEHMYIVTDLMADLVDPFPVIRDLDRGIYVKGDTGKLVIGGFEPDAKCWDAFGPEGDTPFLELQEDWDQFAPFMEAALELVPALETAGIQHFMNGPESFTADTRPLVGEAPAIDGLFVAAGMNSVGVMSSAGIGNALADWVVDGKPAMDLWEVDIARVDPKAAGQEHMEARMEEAVSDLFAMHWPFKQPKAGRNLRQSTLHEEWRGQGAVFGVTAGWERGLWYAGDESEKSLPYSVGNQHWWRVAAREAAQMKDGAVLLDLAPMNKITIRGSQTYEAINHLTCRLIKPDRQVRYAPFLNERGGIEMDATIQSFAPDAVRVITPAATRQRDLAWLRRNLADYDVTLEDETERFVILGLMGAGSRTILEELTGEDLSMFGFGQVRNVEIGEETILTQRLSFVGEYGYELWLPVDRHPEKVFQGLSQAGARPMGHYALENCRMEKGYLHWGHEIGPFVTPLEAGIGFAVNWTKDFVGKDALLAQRENGVTQRVVLLKVEGDALMLHDEPIYEGDDHVGYTTSGGMGPRTGMNLAFGLLSVAQTETKAQTCARTFEVQVAGKRYQAKPLINPPFDPKSERMKP